MGSVKGVGKGVCRVGGMGVCVNGWMEGWIYGIAKTHLRRRFRVVVIFLLSLSPLFVSFFVIFLPWFLPLSNSDYAAHTA